MRRRDRRCAGARTGAPIGLTVAAAVTLAACSQINALTPVGGDSVTSVRNAVYDVLVADDVEILVAPTCATSDTGFLCEGMTLDDQPIVARAGAKAPYDLTIAIGGKTVFEGTAQDVLQRAAEEAS